ncbi:MAG TPA: hypothetical protein VE908_08580 [Mycobacterium sp.]|nr:hypothetical protein [Mycobacterium sp.]
MTRKPEDATWIGPWEDGQRLFDGHSWTVEHTTHNGRPYPITVAVIGKQYLDGRIQRRIAVDVPGDPITTAEARQVIDALTEAVALADTEATDQTKRSRRPTPRGSGRPGEWGSPIAYSDVG